MATSTKREDYASRQLVTPGSASKDYLGRATGSTTDYLGRSLRRTLRANDAVVAVGDEIQFTGGAKFVVTAIGSSPHQLAASPPSITATTHNSTQADGDATIKRQIF